MTLKRTITLFSLCCLVGSALGMPDLPSRCTAFLPKLLQKDIVEFKKLNGLADDNWGQDGEETYSYWTVFSDRSNNTTYDSPSTSSQAVGKLDFNEMVRIAQIEDDFALVYSESQKTATFPLISTSAVCKGWVPMKNLLLWSTCPANEFGIYNKAIFMNNINEAQKIQNKNDIGHYFKNPKTRDGMANISSNYNFYFVMKQDDESGLMLLARESNLNSRNYAVLYGWVHPSMYAPWSQRTCLEPNWNPSIVNVLKGQSVTVYGDKACTQSATSILMGGYEDTSSPNDPLRFRMKPHVLRYPLLDNDAERNIYRISAFARNDGKPYEATADQLADGDAKLQKVLSNMNVVNLIMVIDGTKSMANYFPFVNEAVKQAYSYFGTEGRTVKVGAVIYRDKADGQYETEFCPMRSPKDAKLLQFLQNGGIYGVRSAATDHDDFVSLYKGLELALDAQRMGYNKENSNLMFVVGQCGNDPNDTRSLSQEAIIQKCVNYNIQLSSFMVHNENSQAYNLFRRQMALLVSKNMEQQWTQAKLAKNLGKFEPQPDGYDYKVLDDKVKALFIGSYRQPATGTALDPSRLYAQVKKSAEKFDVAMQSKINIINSANEIVNNATTASASSADGDAASAVEMGFVELMLKDKGVLESFRQSKSLTAFDGYVKKFSDGSASNTGSGKSYYWKPVIYISKPEFDEMMAKLQPVYEAVENDADARKPYVDAMKGLVRSMLPGISEGDMDDMSNEEIMGLVAGLNERTESLESYSLLDIQNEDVVTPNDFRTITSRFVDKYRMLDNIRENKYKFSVKRNGVDWYWIPADDLP